MAAIGQAQANAALVRALLDRTAMPEGSRVLIAGAGTGQMFDYLPAGCLSRYRLLCSDISSRFLQRLRQRLDYETPVDCETVLDNVEDSKLDPGFAAILLVLVLEHVDFPKALASLARLQPERFLVVIQQNPPALASAITPGRELPGTMRVFAEKAPPHLVPFNDLVKELAKHRFHLEHRQEALVADGKKMIGAVFRK